MARELRHLDPSEVSLVDRPAIRRRFLFTKAADGGARPVFGPEGGEPRVPGAGVAQEVLDVLSVPVDGEDAAVAKAEVPAKASGAAVGLLRIAKAWAPDLPAASVVSLLDSAGVKVPAVAKAGGKEPDDDDPDGDDDDAADEEAMKGMSEEEKAAYRKARKARKAAMRKVRKAAGSAPYMEPVRKADGTWDLSGVPADLQPVVKMAWDAGAMAKQERDIRLTREFVAKAAGYGHLGIVPEDFGPVLKALAEKAPEVAERVEAVLKAADEAVAQGALFSEAGRGGAGTSGGAWGEIVAKAEAIVAKGDSGLTKEQAIARVLEQNPALYARYRAEVA